MPNDKPLKSAVGAPSAAVDAARDDLRDKEYAKEGRRMLDDVRYMGLPEHEGPPDTAIVVRRDPDFEKQTGEDVPEARWVDARVRAARGAMAQHGMDPSQGRRIVGKPEAKAMITDEGPYVTEGEDLRSSANRMRQSADDLEEAGRMFAGDLVGRKK